MTTKVTMKPEPDLLEKDVQDEEEALDDNMNEPQDDDSILEDDISGLDDGEPKTLADFDDDEELWEGGPTVGQAKAWKQQYGRVIVGTLDNGDHYVIRPLNRTEYKNHVMNLERARQGGNSSQTIETLDTEEAITLIGLLYPELDRTSISQWGLAGLPSLLSQQIMEISAFVAVDTTEIF